MRDLKYDFTGSIETIGKRGVEDGSDKRETFGPLSDFVNKCNTF